jgi:uncharacterized protein (TIGR00255 family)
MASAPNGIKSMTGFGLGAAQRDGLRLQVELKGVNHRFLDVKMRLPSEVGLMEPQVRAEVQKRVSRARIDIVASIVAAAPAPPRVVINRGLISEDMKAVAALKREFRLKGSVDLETVLALPGTLTIQGDGGSAGGLLTALLTDAVRMALDTYDAMRAAEGARLATDLAGRLHGIRSSVDRIEEEARGLPEAYARRVQTRVATLLEGARPLDETRLAQEVALLAGRVDITEELVRLRGYLSQMEETLGRPPGPIGKTVDFIMQEMNREANTISSKAEALPICREALFIKGEIEKIREQAQNLE